MYVGMNRRLLHNVSAHIRIPYKCRGESEMSTGTVRLCERIPYMCRDESTESIRTVIRELSIPYMCKDESEERFGYAIR